MLLNVFSMNVFGINLWMIYTYTIVSIKDGKKVNVLFHCWPKSWEICSCTRPLLEFERHLVDSGQNIENGGILMQGRGNYCSKLKKGKLKKLKVV